MPLVFLLKGQPGSGKSTIGRALARHLRCPIIDKDDARNGFQPIVHKHPDVDWNTLSYSCMMNYVAAQLDIGLDLVVDCPMARRSLYDQLASIAQQRCGRIVLIECEPSSQELWKERIEARGSQDTGTERDHKPGSWQDVQTVLKRNAGSERWSDDVEFVCRIEIDTTQGDTDQHVQLIIYRLKDAGLLQ